MIAIFSLAVTVTTAFTNFELDGPLLDTSAGTAVNSVYLLNIVHVCTLGKEQNYRVQTIKNTKGQNKILLVIKAHNQPQMVRCQQQ